MPWVPYLLWCGHSRRAYLIDAAIGPRLNPSSRTVARLSELPLNVPQQVVIRDVMPPMPSDNPPQ